MEPSTKPEAGAAAGGSLEEAERKKGLGNAAFQAKKYSEALCHYSEAIDEAGDAVPGVFFSNRAVCRAAMNDWLGARADASESLRRPDGVTKKALFQKARAEQRLDMPEDAAATLQLAEKHGLRADVERLLRQDDGAAAPPAAARKPAASEPLKPTANGAPTNGSNGAAKAAANGAANGAPAAATWKPANSAAAPAAAPPAAAPAAAPAVAPAAAPAAAPAPAAGDEDPAAKAKELGNAKYKEGNYRAALDLYKSGLELLPSEDAQRRAALLGNVAAACIMLRKLEECQQVCEESLELDANNAKIRARLATAQAAFGDFATARATVAAGNAVAKAAGAEGKAALDTLANMARQLDGWENELRQADSALKGGEPARALRLYAELENKALFACPELSLKMGRCHLEVKNYPRVLQATQQVLRGDPRNIEALILRTEALYRNNEALVDSKQWPEPLEQGQRLLKEALSFDPDHAGAQALRKRMRLLCTKHAELKESFDNREFERSEEVLDTMIEQCSDNPAMLGGFYVHRALCGVRRKDWKSVIKDVGQATYRNHSLVQPYLYRALALQNLERHEDAVKELENLFQWHREQNVHDKLQDAKFQLRKSKRGDYYGLLMVPTVASQLEIKKAYRERASEWHPDKKGHLGEEQKKAAEEMFKKIGEAYEVLTNPQKKELYDQGHDLEGIEEKIQIAKQRGGHGMHGHGGCGQSHCGPYGCG